jgi:DNA repair exonuclease SbcCD ATPase subunit
VQELQAYLAQVRQDMEKEDIELHHATTLLANGQKKPSSHVQGHSSRWAGSWVSCLGATEAEKQSITALQEGYQGLDKGDAKLGRQSLSPVCFEESLTTQATDSTAEMLQTLGRQSLSEMLQAGRQSLSPVCSEESLTNQATDNTADMLQTSPLVPRAINRTINDSIDVERLKTDHEQLSTDLRLRHEQLIMAKKEIQLLRERNEEAQKARNELQAALRKLLASMELSQQELEETHEQLITAKKEIQLLEARNEESQKAYQELAATVRREREDSKQKSNDMESSKHRVQLALDAAVRQLEDTTAQLEDSKQKATEMAGDRHRVQLALDAAVRQLEGVSRFGGGGGGPQKGQPTH